MISGSGTVELVYDPDATGQAAFIEDVITLQTLQTPRLSCLLPAPPPALTASFAGIITSMDIASTVGDLVVATCNFITSGTITSNLE